MTYRTILVYFTTSKHALHLAEVAAAIARHQNAHLVGLFATPRVDVYYPPVAVYVSPDVIQATLDHFSHEERKISEAFAAAANLAGVSSEWRHVQAKGIRTADALYDHGRACDLIVVGQFDLDDADDWAGQEDLLMGCGRPLMIVPPLCKATDIVNHVLVAWNGTQESARSVFDALPLIRTAETVTVLSIEPNEADRSRNVSPCDEIAASLARHDVRVSSAREQANGQSIGEVLLQRLEGWGGNLLVMGGYGHTRLREWTFGGVTRHVLQNMKTPVLMSH